MAQVPFAHHARDVAAGPKLFGEGDLRLRQPAGRVREQDPPPGGHHAVANRETAGQQRRPAGGAHTGTHVKAGPFLSLPRHPVQVRRPDGGMTKRAEIAVAEVITEDDDEVGFARRGRAAEAGKEQDRDEAQDGMHGLVKRDRNWFPFWQGADAPRPRAARPYRSGNGVRHPI